MSRPVKIVHVITKLELGGAQQNTLYTVAHLDRARFQPVLVSGPGGLLDPEAVDCPVRHVSALGRAVNPFTDLPAWFQLRHIFSREKPDIVHTHSSKAGILGRAAAASVSVPVVVHTFHGFGFTREQSAPLRAAFIGAERIAAHWSTALIAVSEANRQEAIALGIGRPSQYRLIRSGVDLAPFRAVVHREEAPDGLNIPAGYKLVTTVGPFKPQKNLLDFVRAAEEVAVRYPACRFLIVGDGAGRPSLLREIRKRRLEAFVILAGWRRDIVDILARTHVFCMTSLWEGLPRSLVEAMAAGVPPVVNAVDGCLDLVQNGLNGFLIPPKRPLATADRILRLLADDEMAYRLGQRARLSIGPEFDIQGMVRQQEALYQSLLPPNLV